MLAIVADALKAWDVPGVAVVVVDRDKILWIHGHGVRDITTKVPLSHRTLFPLASCSKAFTTTLIAMLADQGKLSWDDHVQKHLPEFKLADPLANAAVTLRDLATHRTGLASHDYLWYRATWSPQDEVRRAGLLRLDKPFRAAFQYQSTMVAAAGLAAAHAAGKPWVDLVQERIFRPLEMTTASCTTPPASADRASPHRLDRQGRLQVIPWYEQNQPNPAGSIHASAQDLVGWLQFQLGDGSFHGQRLLSAKLLAETHMPQMALRLEGIHRVTNPDTLLMSYALGWVVQDYRGQLLVSHAGALDGFRAHITLMPNAGFGFALLANRHQTRMNLALSNTLVDRLLGLPARDWNAYYLRIVAQEKDAAKAARQKRESERRADLPPSLPLAAYVGTYEHPAYGEARVSLADGQLRWNWSGFHGPMNHWQKDDFEVDDENLAENNVQFDVSGQKVTGLQFLNLPFVKK